MCCRHEIHKLYPNKFVQMDETRFRIFNTLYELPGRTPRSLYTRLLSTPGTT